MRPNKGEEVSQRNSGPGLDIPTLPICSQNPDPLTSVSRLREYHAVCPGYLQRVPQAHVFLQETGNTHQVGIEGLESSYWVLRFLLSLSSGSQLLEDMRDWLKPESRLLAPGCEWRQRQFSGDQSLPEKEW